MSKLSLYVNRFIDQDFVESSNSENKLLIKKTLMKFLESGSREDAYDVILSFFETYKYVENKSNGNFVGLIDTMCSYEQLAGSLLDKLRDHYTHSVYIFILGLAVYESNEKFRKLFHDNFFARNKNYYDNEKDDFFARWGIISLLHDIGYPFEIINEQIKKYINFLNDFNDNSDKKFLAKVEIYDFDEFIKLPEIIPVEDMCKDFMEEYKAFKPKDLLNPLNLLAQNFHDSLGIELSSINERLKANIERMQKSGFTDHGYFSALTICKWYYFITQKSGLNPSYFFNLIVDSASAVLLHNYYPHNLIKSLNFPVLSAKSHLMGYLLILCDEIQDWNRIPYGKNSKNVMSPMDYDIDMDNENFKFTYHFTSEYNEEYKTKKLDKIVKTIDVSDLYENFTIDSDIQKTAKRVKIYESSQMFVNLQNIARKIHENYVANQVEGSQTLLPRMESWDNLDLQYKLDNIAQAKTYAYKLDILGYFYSEKDLPFVEIKSFTEEEVEKLARMEHERWVHEKIANNWRYGKVKDLKLKTSPYIVHWIELDDLLKKKDKDPIYGMIPLLNSIGLKVYKKQ